VRENADSDQFKFVSESGLRFPRLFVFCLLFAFVPVLSFAQNTQHLTWGAVPGSANYEILIERLQSGSDVAYLEYTREWANTALLDIVLPEGSYRFRIFGYDSSNVLNARSDWMVFKVSPPLRTLLPPQDSEIAIIQMLAEERVRTSSPPPIKAPDAKGYFSASFGIEANLNRIDFLGVGTLLAGEYRVNDDFGSGLRLRTSYDFSRLLVFDGEVFLRWYAPAFGSVTGYLEGASGASILTVTETGSVISTLFALSAGARVNFNEWYVEPFLRGGVPFIAGAGIAAGYHFK